MSLNKFIRKMGICKECNIFKLMHSIDNLCINCLYRFKGRNDKIFYLKRKYTQMRQRVSNIKKNHSTYYFGLKICSRKDFFNKFINDKNYNLLFDNWVKSEWEYNLIPSIDRINPEEGYTLDNIQFITMIENLTKDRKRCPINVYDINDNFIRRFKSGAEAAKILSIQQSNIWKVLKGERRSAGNFKFRKA